MPCPDVVHADDTVIDAKGMVDVPKIPPLARMGYYDYTRVDSRFGMIIGGNSQALRAGLEFSADKAGKATGRNERRSPSGSESLEHNLADGAV